MIVAENSLIILGTKNGGVSPISNFATGPTFEGKVKSYGTIHNENYLVIYPS